VSGCVLLDGAATPVESAARASRPRERVLASLVAHGWFWPTVLLFLRRGSAGSAAADVVAAAGAVQQNVGSVGPTAVLSLDTPGAAADCVGPAGVPHTRLLV